MADEHARLLYGRERLGLNLPPSVGVLEMTNIPIVPDAERAVAKALEAPIECEPLGDLACGRRNACIVISDITRPVPNRIILPSILKTLEMSGIARDDITILIATGMHRPNEGNELESMVGPEIVADYRIVNHYCRKPDSYRRIAEIDGAPIEINSAYLDADLKILTGLIEPHFYAGYSGGCKSILPGLSSFETMRLMHSYKMIDHPRVTNCVLDGNPFHEYGLRIADVAGVDFIVNVVIDRQRQIAGVYAGHHDAAHRAGCAKVYEHAIVRLNQPADLVITSGGGHPLDATFYQISKALICAKNIVRNGGTIVVACECKEGLGNAEFCGILDSARSPQVFFKRYSEPDNFVIDQWCAQSIFQALDHAGQVYVYSVGLNQQELEKTGIIKIDDLQATVDDLLKVNPQAVVVPDGPYVVGMFEQLLPRKLTSIL